MKDTRILNGIKGISEAAKLINNGSVVVFPTETVYGLGANAFNENAVKKIFEVKGRPQDNPLIIHISSKDQIPELVEEITPFAQKIIDKFMPGPITVIMKKKKIVPDVVTAGLDSVGIRMPMHKMARKFIEKCNCPIAAPSANISTHISPTNAIDVYEDLKGKVDIILDGGNCSVGIESTIVDMTKDIPIILRPGGVTMKKIVDTIGVCQNFKGEVKIALAPGMKYKHYAPNCDMVIAKKTSIISEYEKQIKLGKNPIIICENSIAKSLSKQRYISVGKSGKEIMKNIFATMHEAQKISDYIICQDFGTRGVRSSVMNRVLKASGGVIV